MRAGAGTRDLLHALRDVEGDLARARTVYNRTVQTYEDRRRSLPGVLVAAPLGFAPRAFWQAEPADRE